MGSKLRAFFLTIALLSGSLDVVTAYETSTSVSQKEKPAPEAWTAVPFDDLRAVRVMIALMLPEGQQVELAGKILEEFGEIGQVHTPKDTSVETVEKALSVPFGFLMLEVAQIGSETEALPFLHLSLKMYEMGTLELNQHKWMGIVWEKQRYCRAGASTQDIAGEVSAMLQAFAEEFYRVNPKTIRPHFYIGKPIYTEVSSKVGL